MNSMFKKCSLIFASLICIFLALYFENDEKMLAFAGGLSVGVFWMYFAHLMDEH